MISVKWIIFIFFIGSILSLLGGVMEGSIGNPLPWNDLMATYESVQSFGDFVMQIPNLATGTVTAFWNMLSFNYSYLQGDWEIVRWFLFMPLAAAIGFGIIYSLLALARGGGG